MLSINMLIASRVWIPVVPEWAICGGNFFRVWNKYRINYITMFRGKLVLKLVLVLVGLGQYTVLLQNKSTDVRIRLLYTRLQVIETFCTVKKLWHHSGTTTVILPLGDLYLTRIGVCASILVNTLSHNTRRKTWAIFRGYDMVTILAAKGHNALHFDTKSSYLLCIVHHATK